MLDQTPRVKLPHRGTYTHYGVQLQPIRSSILRVILYGLPWAILILLLIYLTQFKDVLFFTALIAAAMTLFAFQMLMQQVPEVFDILWSRNIIALKANPQSSSVVQTIPSSVGAETPDLRQMFADYLTRVEVSLNHPGSLILGLVFGLFGIARFPYEAGSWNTFVTLLLRAHLEFWFEFIFEGFIGFILGLMAWRMLFIALQVSQLEKRFDLQVQFDHPDRAGGLEPLGNLCLWNALILSIPGIFLGVWILIGSRFPDYLDPQTHSFFYNDLYYKMILVPIILAPVTFILPLWSVHRLMAEKAVRVRRDLDQLGELIDRFGRELLSHAEEGASEERQKMAKNLELMQQIYQANRSIPVWPLNVNVVIKFATSQVVPLLVLTGLGQPILKIVDAMAKFIGQ